MLCVPPRLPPPLLRRTRRRIRQWVDVQRLPVHRTPSTRLSRELCRAIIHISPSLRLACIELILRRGDTGPPAEVCFGAPTRRAQAAHDDASGAAFDAPEQHVVGCATVCRARWNLQARSRACSAGATACDCRRVSCLSWHGPPSGTGRRASKTLLAQPGPGVLAARVFWRVCVLALVRRRRAGALGRGGALAVPLARRTRRLHRCAGQHAHIDSSCAQVREYPVPGYSGTALSWAPSPQGAAATATATTAAAAATAAGRDPSAAQLGAISAQLGAISAQLGESSPAGSYLPASSAGFLAYNVGDTLLFVDQV